MIRTQLESDGTLTIWKYNDDALGIDYMGPKVSCTRTKVKLTEARRKILEESEARTLEMDSRIRSYRP